MSCSSRRMHRYSPSSAIMIRLIRLTAHLPHGTQAVRVRAGRRLAGPSRGGCGPRGITRSSSSSTQQHAAARSTQHAALVPAPAPHRTRSTSTSTRTRTAPAPAPAAPAPVAPAQHQRHHQPPPTHPPPAPRISTGRRHGRTTPSWRGSHRTLHRSRGVAGGRSS